MTTRLAVFLRFMLLMLHQLTFAYKTTHPHTNNNYTDDKCNPYIQPYYQHRNTLYNISIILAVLFYELLLLIMTFLAFAICDYWNEGTVTPDKITDEVHDIHSPNVIDPAIDVLVHSKIDEQKQHPPVYVIPPPKVKPTIERKARETEQKSYQGT
jgi:hypothetical protein